MIVREGAAWDLPGVFDAKWQDPTPLPPETRHTIGIAAADGRLKLYTLSRDPSVRTESEGPSVSCPPDLIAEGDAPTEGAMALVLDWSHGPARDRIACSYSSGEVAVWRLDGAGALRREAAWGAHSLEAWSCAFHPQSDPEASVSCRHKKKGPEKSHELWSSACRRATN